MRKLIITAIAILAATTASVAQESTIEKEYVLNVGDFTEMTVADGVNIVYRAVPDSAGLATFVCAPEIAPAITFSNNKYKLKIQVTDDSFASDDTERALPTVTIYSNSLQKVTNWSDSTVTVESVSPCASFKAIVEGNGMVIAKNVRATQVEGSVNSGNGRVFVSGKTQVAKLHNVGTGTVEGGMLEAPKVKCMMFGTGSIDCYATEELTVTGASSGQVYYRGNPKIKNRSLGVKILQVK